MALADSERARLFLVLDEIERNRAPALPRARLLERLGDLEKTVAIVGAYQRGVDARYAAFLEQDKAFSHALTNKGARSLDEWFAENDAVFKQRHALGEAFSACERTAQKATTDALLKWCNRPSWAHDLGATRALLEEHYRAYPRPCPPNHIDTIAIFMHRATVLECAVQIAELATATK